MVFDFKGMEVFMLAWMSKDPLLQELCKSPDVYNSLYEKIMDKKSDGKNDREMVKKFFLPVIYGQTANGVAGRCEIDISLAEQIVNRIGALFPVALAFVEGYQKQLQELGYAKDIFGKRRYFEVGKEFSVRNFSVQSPAAVVCLEKLTHLYFALKNKSDLAYTVHDGYAVYATKDNWKTIYKIGREILSGESEFCPGLRLRVTCRAGRNLNDLKSLAHKGD
jgi:DNA polymerase I-like protein with 3'-5' exonuclease and polymerase domains